MRCRLKVCLHRWFFFTDGTYDRNAIRTPLMQTMPTSGLLTVKCHQHNPNVYIAIVKFALDRISKVWLTVFVGPSSQQTRSRSGRFVIPSDPMIILATIFYVNHLKTLILIITNSTSVFFFYQKFINTCSNQIWK